MDLILYTLYFKHFFPYGEYLRECKESYLLTLRGVISFSITDVYILYLPKYSV